VKNLQQWAAVQELYKKKVPILQIAKQLKMSRNTVKKLIKLKEEPKYKRTKTSSKIDQYKDQVTIWRTDACYDFNGTRIYKELRKLGYHGSLSPIYRYLNKIDEEKCKIPSIATVRVETPAGDQAQFDWAHYEVMVGGRYQTVYCFSMILAATRLKSICFSLSIDSDAIYEAVQELFEDLGGVTLELLIDNPKAFVIENKSHFDEEVQFNPQALLLAAHIGTELNACQCFRGKTKGKVEKPFQYIEEQFVKGNSFESMEALNKEGKAFIKEWNNEVHGTTKRIPYEHYLQEEARVLLPLPKKKIMQGETKTRTVSPDCYVSIDTNKYSVPAVYAGSVVRYRIVYGFRLEIYTEEKIFITAWNIKDGKESIQRNPEHYKAISAKVNKSIPQIKRDFTHTFTNGAKYLELVQHKNLQQLSYHARKILGLLDLYSVDTLDKVLEYCIENGMAGIDPFKKVLKEKYLDILMGAGVESEKQSVIAETGLIRSCSYYENESVVTDL
jgi:transposase